MLLRIYPGKVPNLVVKCIKVSLVMMQSFPQEGPLDTHISLSEPTIRSQVIVRSSLEISELSVLTRVSRKM